jgi:DNA recombination protein RmuC
MENAAIVVLGVLAVVAVVAAAWLAVDRARWIERLKGQEAEHRAEVEAVREQSRQEVERERQVAAAKVRAAEEMEARTREYVEQAESRFRTAFGALAGDSLKAAQKQFLELAQEAMKGHLKDGDAAMTARKAEVERLVQPIAEALRKSQETLALMEKERVGAYAGLREQVQQNLAAQAELRAETAKLVRALREPQVRGRYGEVQLRRVAELAGMSPYCDFAEQEQIRDLDGNPLRPDMVVRLPNGRHLAIDAKTNIQAYIDAAGAATPEEAEACMDRFARHVAEQVAALGRKAYWQAYDGSPEFTVMFVPGDQFVDAAMSRRPDLVEKAAAANVILASPSTLIGLLRAVAVGWREKRLEEQARELFDLGRQLHERAAVVTEHLARMGGSLEQAVKRFNDLVASYQSRLEPTLRRFEEAGAKSAKELAAVEAITIAPRLLAPGGDGAGPRADGAEP